MGLSLVNAAERHVFEGDGYKIFFRRITNQKRNQIVQRHTNRRGEPDNAAIADEILEYCVTGWEGVEEFIDGAWTEVPFSQDKVRLIPDEVGGELMERLGANLRSKEVEVGNSETTPASNTTTKGSRAGDAEEKQKKTTSSS
jgi:hypothetical protein